MYDIITPTENAMLQFNRLTCCKGAYCITTAIVS